MENARDVADTTTKRTIAEFYWLLLFHHEEGSFNSVQGSPLRVCRKYRVKNEQANRRKRKTNSQTQKQTKFHTLYNVLPKND